MRTCHSGLMSRAVRKTALSCSGRSARSWIDPSRCARARRSRATVVRRWQCHGAPSKTGLTSTSFLPSRTCRVKASENSGSMPEEQLAMIEIVPVGAIVVTWALRMSRPSRCVSHTLPFQLGNGPRVSARCWLAAQPVPG